MKLLILASVLFALSFFLGDFLKEKSSKENEAIKILSDCDLTESSCNVLIDNQRYIFSFAGEPSPLTPFYLHMKTDTEQWQNVVVSFEMKGMDMGFNQFQLKKTSEDWGARILLPVCSLGRNDWTMSVFLKSTDITYVLEFEFDQVTESAL